jgi:predicted RNA-binding protein with PIN domain
MNYIIDGHNLVSHIPGLSLSMLDDEQRLVELLILFCRESKHKVEVYFDRATVGQSGTTNHGKVRAHFVPERLSADDAIRRRLRSMGKSASTWAVVSSDRSVQAAGREAYAQVLSADEFANLLLSSLHPKGTAPTSPVDEPLSEAEIREWEAIFKQGRKPK